MLPGPVVIVGAGPVGLTTALLLARRDVPVLVLERHLHPLREPRAVHLDDEAMRALADVGVADDLVRAGRALHGLRLLDPARRVLAEFGRDPDAGLHGWPQATAFHQPDLEDLLRAAVVREPLVELRTGVEVTGLRETSGGVEVHGTDRSVPAAAVVGCDGANSTVRGAIGARMRRLGRADHWLVADLRSPTPVPIWPGVHQVCDPQRPMTFLPIAADRYRFETRLRPGESVAELAARLPAMLTPFGAAPAEVVRLADYTYRAQVADRWRAGRILLAGDAAHQSPPFIGQGLGLGLRDAHQLSWKLAAVVRGAADEALLDTHQAEREPHARALVRLAVLVGALMSGGGRRAAAVRRAVLVGADRVPAVTAFATDSRSPALPGGPLVERDGRAGRRLAGRLLPRAPVLVEGVPRRVDDVLGPGTAVLRFGVGREAVAHAGGHRIGFCDVDGVLGAWRGTATEVVVRPDRIVRTAR